MHVKHREPIPARSCARSWAVSGSANVSAAVHASMVRGYVPLLLPALQRLWQVGQGRGQGRPAPSVESEAVVSDTHNRDQRRRTPPEAGHALLALAEVAADVLVELHGDRPAAAASLDALTR